MEVQFMSSEAFHMFDLFYNSRKAGIYFYRDYKFTKKAAYLLHKPMYTVKAVKSVVNNLTYRKINDWEQKKIISFSRNKKAGWRQFSKIDIIKLFIISDLKRFGFQSDKIRGIINQISNSSVEFYHRKTKKSVRRKFLELEHSFFQCTSEIKNLIFLNKNGKIYFFAENDVQLFYFYNKDDLPLLTLPFFDYVAKTFGRFPVKENIRGEIKVSDLLQNNLTEREKNILMIIENGDYEEILIRKTNNEKIFISAKSRKSGDFTEKDILNMIKSKNYQRVTVINDKGKTVSLIQEQRFKA